MRRQQFGVGELGWGRSPAPGMEGAGEERGDRWLMGGTEGTPREAASSGAREGGGDDGRAANGIPAGNRGAARGGDIAWRRTGGEAGDHCPRLSGERCLLLCAAAGSSSS